MANGSFDNRVFPEFERDVSKSLKQYRRCRKDVEAFARILDADPGKHRGNQMQGFTPYSVYKARVVSQDIPGGKSKGFRVILLDDQGVYRFVCIYTHNTEPREDRLRQQIRERLIENGFRELET